MLALKTPSRPAARLASASPPRAWGFAMLVYMLGLIVCVTLLPFRFHWPDTSRVLWYANVFDIVTNVALFIPFGFVHQLSLPQRRGHWITLWVGLGISLGIEMAQLGLPGRYSSVLDVLSNGTGAWMGALLHAGATRTLQPRSLDKLALELPLMQLFYMLLPLLWLTSVVGSVDPHHLWLTVILQWYGGSIVGAVWRHRLRPARALSSTMLGLVIVGWFFLGTLPALTIHPWWRIGAGCGSALGLWGLLVWCQPDVVTERRFELPTLRWLAPLYALYLSILLLWPWPWAPGSWQGSLGFARLADTPGVVPVLRLLEELTALTLAGYMIAEYRGRQVTSLGQTLRWILLVCLGFGGCLEGLRGWHPAHTASLAHLGLLTVAAAYGGLIYRLQLAMVQSLLQQRKMPMSYH